MAWTNVLKPSETSVLGGTGGVPIGLLMALTYAGDFSSVVTGWTDIAKPVGTASWVSVAKPTSSVWTMIAKPTT